MEKNVLVLVTFVLFICTVFFSCQLHIREPSENLLPNANTFKKSIDGKKADLFVLTSAGGMQAAITNYGGRLVNLIVPDREGLFTNVVVGFDNVSGYQESTEPYFGASIGRYGNRIANGKFSLDGSQYALSINNGPNTLHGGKNGFQNKAWDAKQLNDSTLELSYFSKDGEEGFPGNLTSTVIYRLIGNKLQLEYSATTDQPTVINLTNHAFFNLNGEGSGTINHHVLQINADQYTPVDSTLIPNGTIEPVVNTPFDFTKPTTIGSRVNENHLQLQYGGGYDHNYVLKGSGMKHAATVIGNKSGIQMDVYTEEPGLQFYGGNFMRSKNTMRKGMDDYRTAFCLETQHFPNSPNQPSFPSTVLRPGEKYHTVSEYRFSVQK